MTRLILTCLDVVLRSGLPPFFCVLLESFLGRFVVSFPLAFATIFVLGLQIVKEVLRAAFLSLHNQCLESIFVPAPF